MKNHGILIICTFPVLGLLGLEHDQYSIGIILHEEAQKTTCVETLISTWLQPAMRRCREKTRNSAVINLLVEESLSIERLISIDTT
jgi:hypothetical protein